MHGVQLSAPGPTRGGGLSTRVAGMSGRSDGELTYKVVPIFEVASNGNLAGSIALGLPFTPVKGIKSPWRQIIARAGLHVGKFILKGPGRAVRQGRVGSGTDVGQAQGRVRKVPLRRCAILARLRGRYELRGACGGATRRGRGVGRVGRRRGFVGATRARAVAASRDGEVGRLRWGLVVVLGIHRAEAGSGHVGG